MRDLKYAYTIKSVLAVRFVYQKVIFAQQALNWLNGLLRTKASFLQLLKGLMRLARTLLVSVNTPIYLQLMNSTLRSKIEKVLWIMPFWTFISLSQFYVGYEVAIDLNYNTQHVHFWVPFRTNLMVGILAGLVGGSIIVFVWERWLRTKPYKTTLISIFLSYTLLYCISTLLASQYYHSEVLDIPFLSLETWQYTVLRSLRIPSIFSFFFWLFVVILTLIGLIVNDKYGPGIFLKFLMGAYFQPKREERIFMFLDLRSSTSIAESLGEKAYFNFLKDVFECSTPAILNNKGEVYQYVGDEIVISWPISNKIDINAIKCYFDVKKSIQDKAPYFIKKYSIVPEFKAGLHAGSVMAGEIGVVKREIAYSGDVLNTASRVQGLCNELDVDILVTQKLLDRIKPQLTKFDYREIGHVPIRGKSDIINLYTLQPSLDNLA